MTRKPGLFTVLFLLLMLGGKLLYAATLPVVMPVQHDIPQQQHQHCHDGDTSCDTAMVMDHASDHCAKSCLASCASHAMPTMTLADLSFHKPGSQFSFTSSRPSRRLDTLYRPPHA